MQQSLIPTTDRMPAQANNDQHLVDLWLHDRGPETQRAYRTDVDRLLAFVDKPLHAVTLGDLQAFADSLIGLAPTSRSRRLAAVKSLIAFGHLLGYLPFDVGRALRLPSTKNTRAERILPEPDVQRMLALETNQRNHALLMLLYAGGLRVSEVCALCCRDLQPRGDAGQVNTFGKGRKTRAVLLSATTWRELEAIRADRGPDAPLFVSRNLGGHLSALQVLRIVRAAARRAGIAEDVSPHWLRHAHASHALDRGCPISLVQATLGHDSMATTGQYLHARPNDSSARYLAV